MALSSVVAFNLCSSAFRNRYPFRADFSLGKGKQSHGVRSGEREGCGTIGIFLSAENSRIDAAERSGALSGWWKPPVVFAHFFLSILCRRRINTPWMEYPIKLKRSYNHRVRFRCVSTEFQTKFHARGLFINFGHAENDTNSPDTSTSNIKPRRDIGLWVKSEVFTYTRGKYRRLMEKVTVFGLWP